MVAIPEAARELGMSRQTLWRHINRGHLMAKKIGRDYLIERTELARFDAERRKGPGRPPKVTEYVIRPSHRLVAEAHASYDA